MDPHLTASQSVLDELYDALTALLRPLDEDCLNWTPTDDESNSIAALVHHIAGSLDNWLTRALGEPVVRDRDAEFRGRGDAATLVAIIERSRTRSHAAFARLDGVDRGTMRHVQRALPQPHESDVPVGWCIEHAIIHAGEHWGQIQLTRQLYAARSASPHKAGVS